MENQTFLRRCDLGTRPRGRRQRRDKRDSVPWCWMTRSTSSAIATAV